MHVTDLSNTWQRLRGGLIVSCQALPDEPLYGSSIMVAVARAAATGGAAGLRANGSADIVAIRAVLDLPIIGLDKAQMERTPAYITPTLGHARGVMEAGADMVAVDATARPHLEGGDGAGFVAFLKRELGAPILADISTLEEGLAAADAGADAVSTTLSGYTAYSRQAETWDADLVQQLASRLHIPVIAEGRIWTPMEARQALDLGAFAVVVGSAITRPQLITERFVRALDERARE
jgi:N-acylglucosamine-6-phosphate 2-epimerase